VRVRGKNEPHTCFTCGDGRLKEAAMLEEIWVPIRAWGENRIGILVLILMTTIGPLAASAAEGPKPVFIHAACDGKLSSTVLSAFRDEIQTSQKYQLAPDLEDNGHLDIVLTIYMSCTERHDVVAIATSYGLAKCFSDKTCHSTVDSVSIRSALCDASAVGECGRTLFKTFDDYTRGPKPELRLD
jgi:hypothetical protein